MGSGASLDRAITWQKGICGIDNLMKVRLAGATTAVFGIAPNLNTMNIAHVFPCGEMKNFIDQITDVWVAANGRQKLKHFVHWLFTIDTEAVIQGKYLTGNANDYIDFRDLLDNADMGDGYGLLSTTFWGFYIPKLNQARKNNALHIIDTHCTDTLPLDNEWANKLVTQLTNAPSNLRYGHKETNSVVGCMIDPVGNTAGYPTTKECEMIKANAFGQPTNLRTRYENEETGDFYGGQLPPGEFYSSTGLYNWQALDKNGDPVTMGGKKKNRVLENLRYSEEPLLGWTACYNRAPNPDWTI